MPQAKADPHPARTQQLMSIAEESLGIEARLAGLSMAGDEYLSELCKEAIDNERIQPPSAHNLRMVSPIARGTLAVHQQRNMGSQPADHSHSHHPGSFSGLYIHGSGDKQPLGLGSDNSLSSLGPESSLSTHDDRHAVQREVTKQPHEWYGKLARGEGGGATGSGWAGGDSQPPHQRQPVSGPYYGRPSLMSAGSEGKQGSILHGLGGHGSHRPTALPTDKFLGSEPRGPVSVDQLVWTSIGQWTHDMCMLDCLNDACECLLCRPSKAVLFGGTTMTCQRRMIPWLGWMSVV